MAIRKLFGLLLALSASTAFAEVRPGENFFDSVRAISQMNERAPQHLRSIEKLLRESCATSSNSHACEFPRLLRAHAEAFRDWKDLAEGQNPFQPSDILLRPRWDYQDVRGGIWNVNSSDREGTARLSALAAARFIASSVVLERAFAEVAEWMGTWGSPLGAFQPVIRPVVAAFLSSGNPLAQISAFSAQMKCAAGQTACLSVKARLGRWLFGKAARASALRTKLQAARFVDEPTLLAVYEQNSAFRAFLEKDWWEVATRLDKPQSLLELPAFQAYVHYLAERALTGQNLMGGRYSLADEILATVLLADLAGLATVEPAPVAETLSPEGEKIFARLDADFEKAFAPYAQALRALE